MMASLSDANDTQSTLQIYASPRISIETVQKVDVISHGEWPMMKKGNDNKLRVSSTAMPCSSAVFTNVRQAAIK